jgi:DNA gyrase subunit A
MQRERITAVIPIKEFAEDKFLIAVTKHGTIKKTPLSQFDTNRKTGLIAVSLKEGDELIGIKQTTGANYVIIVTKYGKCICFSEEDVRSMGRIAGGVRAIKLEKDDEVVAMELVEPNEELLVVTKNGYGKRTSVEDYKVQVRGGKGLLTYDKAKFKKTGELIGAMVVNDSDEILLINSDGIIIRIRAIEVSRLGRATQGVKIMRVDEDANIIALAKVIKSDEDEGDGAESRDEISGEINGEISGEISGEDEGGYEQIEIGEGEQG